MKLLVPPPAGAHLARERLRREVHAVRGLSHPNIVAVFDLLDDGPVELHRHGVRRRRRPAPCGSGSVARSPRTTAVRVGRDVAAALAAAHRRGILHRDVKPQNILLDADGRARLTDFGSAKLDGQLGITGTGALAGTVAYAAPEVLAGRRGDARTDVYALGLTLYWALTGELPEPAIGPPAAATAAGGVPARAARARLSASGSTPWSPGPPRPLPRTASHRGWRSTRRWPPPLAALRADAGPTALRALRGRRPARARPLSRLRRRARRRRRHPRLPRSRRTARPSAGRWRRGSPTCSRRRPRPAGRGRRRGASVRSFASPRRDPPGWSARSSDDRLPARAVPATRRAGAGSQGATWPWCSASPSRAWAPGSPRCRCCSTPRRVMGGLLLLARGPEAARAAGGARPRLTRAAPGSRGARGPGTGELPPGTARNLLADVTRLARPMFGRFARSGDDRDHAPAAARARLLRVRRRDRPGNARRRASPGSSASAPGPARRPADWLDALARCERARDALVQRLLEAMAVLGRLQSQATFAVTAEDASLAEVTRELGAEATAQAAAAREITQLLNQPS